MAFGRDVQQGGSKTRKQENRRKYDVKPIKGSNRKMKGKTEDELFQGKKTE